MITAAFEWEFHRAYPDGIPKEEATVKVGEDYDEIINIFGRYLYKLNRENLVCSEMGERLVVGGRDKLTKETKVKLVENNNKVSDLLKENEELLLAEGYNPPVNNYTLDKNDKIKIPSGYIRVNETFQKKYHLKQIVAKKSTIKNLAYSLQLSDFYNFIINRYNMWGSVETMLYKNAIINLVSIFEALLFECANNICSPTGCSLVSVCTKHFSKPQRNNSFEALKKINDLNITDFSNDEILRINEIISFRNRVHIRLSTDNEFNSSDFSLSLYNEIIALLQRLSQNIYKNGVPLYGKCDC